MPALNTISITITADSDPMRYALWFAIASTRTLGGIPTPLHEIMVDAGLWHRARLTPNGALRGDER